MTLSLREKIVAAARQIIIENAWSRDVGHIGLENPKEKKFGDWSLNVAMRLAKECKRPPLDIARALAEQLVIKLTAEGCADSIAGIDVKAPGFINIFLSPKALYDMLRSIKAEGDNFGRSRLGKGQKVLLEFVSANPTGPLSIAHARQAAVGDTLANILDFCGYAVSREYYINDEGNQIRNLGLSLRVRYLELLGHTDVEFPENGYKGDYLYDMAKKIIAEKGDAFAQNEIEEILPFFSAYAADEILGGIREELAAFGVGFDQWYSQKHHITRERIDAVIAALRERGYIYEQEGATWFRSTDFGDDKDRVIIKSDGLFTYLTPDIAYHKLKFERGFDKLINIWGPDHHGYINRLKASVCALGYTRDALEVIIIQLATLFRDGNPVKMSTRAGEYITLQELVQEVGKDAARFFFLMRRCDSQLEFDLELAKKKTMENPVYYIQYAHARVCGIFEAVRKAGFDPEAGQAEADLSILQETEALELIRKLNCFSDVLAGCSVTLDPQGITTYLRELAGEFHAYYNKFRILTGDTPDDWKVTRARVFLIAGVRQVLRNGMRLMGVQAPESM